MLDHRVVFLCSFATSLGHHVDGDVDVAPCSFGIRTCLVRSVNQRLRDFALQTRQGDIETAWRK
jgi:hypothetical protein